MESSLTFSVETNKKTLAMGETILVTARIRNSSASRVLKLRQLAANTIGNVKVRDQRGKELRGFVQAIRQIPSPSSKDFVALDPDEQWTMNFRGTLREETKKDIHTTGHPPVSGLFLDFEDSAILIPGRGIYDLTIEIRDRKDIMMEFQSALGIQNAWHGQLTGTVQIEVK